jgi:hypothetical protein
MSWNYRLMRFPVPAEHSETGYWHAVHEVYYNENGEPHGHTERKVGVGGDTPEEVRQAYELMGQSFSKPILHYSEDEGYQEVTE